MPPRHTHVFIATSILACLANVIIACGIDYYPAPLGLIVAGFFQGCIVGQIFLAAAWIPLGPLSFRQRVIYSTTWLVAVQVAVGIACYRNLFGNQWNWGMVSYTLIYLLAMFGQWIFVQIPLWLLYVSSNLRMSHFEELQPSRNLRGRQFSILHVMIVTAILSLFFAIFRGIWPFFIQGEDARANIENAFVLIVPATFLTPLFLAVLLARYRFLAMVVALLLLTVGTYVEIVWFASFARMTLADIQQLLISTNVVACLWILFVTSLLQWSGYRLRTAMCSINTDIAANKSV